MSPPGDLSLPEKFVAPSFPSSRPNWCGNDLSSCHRFSFVRSSNPTGVVAITAFSRGDIIQAWACRHPTRKGPSSTDITGTQGPARWRRRGALRARAQRPRCGWARLHPSRSGQDGQGAAMRGAPWVWSWSSARAVNGSSRGWSPARTERDPIGEWDPGPGEISGSGTPGDRWRHGRDLVQ
jgi:hypothetical protein